MPFNLNHTIPISDDNRTEKSIASWLEQVIHIFFRLPIIAIKAMSAAAAVTMYSEIVQAATTSPWSCMNQKPIARDKKNRNSNNSAQTVG